MSEGYNITGDILRRENEALRAAVNAHAARNAELQAENASLRAEIESLRQSSRKAMDMICAALEAVEWVSDAYPSELFGECPWCHANSHDHHKPDCQRQIALGKAAG